MYDDTLPRLPRYATRDGVHRVAFHVAKGGVGKTMVDADPQGYQLRSTPTGIATCAWTSWW